MGKNCDESCLRIKPNIVSNACNPTQAQTLYKAPSITCPSQRHCTASPTCKFTSAASPACKYSSSKNIKSNLKKHHLQEKKKQQNFFFFNPFSKTKKKKKKKKKS